MGNFEYGGRVRHLVLFGILAVLAGSAATVRAQSSLNVVYVESNIGCAGNGLNSVFGFSNDGSGVLTALPSSPYNTNGSGVCDNGQVKGKSEFDANQQVLINPNSLLLYAVNGNSNNFSVFSLHHDGSLVLDSGSPVGSNGSDPVSFTELSGFLSNGSEWLAVINKGADPNQTDLVPNVSIFQVNRFGRASLLPGTTLTLNSGSSPSQMIEAAGSSGSNNYWTYLDQYESGGASDPAGVYTYRIIHSGALQAVNSATGPANPPALGMVASPKYRVIYTTFPTLDQIGVLTYDIKTGKITYNSAVTDPGTGLGWLAINAAGGSLYASEAGSGSISIYKVSNGGLTLTEKTQFKLSGTATPGNLAFDPTGKFLYCLDNVHSTLHVLTVNQVSGQLTEPNAPTVLNEGTSEEALGLAAFSITQ